ncbi:MAG: hypothetical protein AAF650_05115 [Pseudomonadota bacterium]
MIRLWAAIGALALGVSGLTLAQDAERQTARVELTLAGPPVEAEETATPSLFQEPVLPPGIPEEYGGGYLAQSWSLLGREDRSAQVDPSEYKRTQCLTPADPVIGAAAVLDTIADKASGTRVVIINESHVNTLHRGFSQQIIRRLRPLDFTVFAAETFGNTNDGPDPVELYADLAYPHYAEGSYSQEPVFGSLVRTAKQLGFVLAAYEEVSEPGAGFPTNRRLSIEARETAQAANLAALLEAMEPHERLVVHVGYSHAREKVIVEEDGWETAWMAARLKRLTGIDPLTIEQTYCRGGSDFVRLSEANEREKGWFDLHVDHPAYGFRHGRPDWRFAQGAQAIAIPEPYASAEEPLVIEAFAEGEPFEAVPVDRVWVDPGEDVKLALKPGRYTVRAVRPSPVPSWATPKTAE